MASEAECRRDRLHERAGDSNGRLGEMLARAEAADNLTANLRIHDKNVDRQTRNAIGNIANQTRRMQPKIGSYRPNQCMASRGRRADARARLRRCPAITTQTIETHAAEGNIHMASAPPEMTVRRICSRPSRLPACVIEISSQHRRYPRFHEQQKCDGACRAARLSHAAMSPSARRRHVLRSIEMRRNRVARGHRPTCLAASLLDIWASRLCRHRQLRAGVGGNQSVKVARRRLMTARPKPHSSAVVRY